MRRFVHHESNIFEKDEDSEKFSASEEKFEIFENVNFFENLIFFLNSKISKNLKNIFSSADCYSELLSLRMKSSISDVESFRMNLFGRDFLKVL